MVLTVLPATLLHVYSTRGGVMDSEQVLSEFRERWYNWKPDDWEYTLEAFLRRGLTADDISDAITITQWKGRQFYWKYFCGVCWKKLAALREAPVYA
jgi:hypothetical protein